jgi:hypothetical protein
MTAEHLIEWAEKNISPDKFKDFRDLDEFHEAIRDLTKDTSKMGTGKCAENASYQLNKYIDGDLSVDDERNYNSVRSAIEESKISDIEGMDRDDAEEAYEKMKTDGIYTDATLKKVDEIIKSMVVDVGEVRDEFNDTIQSAISIAERAKTAEDVDASLELPYSMGELRRTYGNEFASEISGQVAEATERLFDIKQEKLKG